MKSIISEYRSAVDELVSACRRCAELGYVTSAGGNLSIRVSKNIILITPTKTPKRDVTVSDICAVDPDGNTIYAPEGKAPTGETPFHTRIYRLRSDIKAIVHAHPAALTGFAIAGTDILEKAILPEPAMEIGPIVTVPYETPLSEELSDNIGRVIGRSNGFLMENHGALFCSPHGVIDALDMLQMAENMAVSVAVATVLGNARPIGEKYIQGIADVAVKRHLPVPGGVPGNSVSDLFRVHKEKTTI